MPDTLPTCWLCDTCGVAVMSKKKPAVDYHAHGWGRDGISVCPGKFEPGTFVPRAASGEQRRALLSLLGYEVEHEPSAPVNNCERWSFQGNYCIEGAGCACIALRPADRLVLRDQRETTDA